VTEGTTKVGAEVGDEVLRGVAEVVEVGGRTGGRPEESGAGGVITAKDELSVGFGSGSSSGGRRLRDEALHRRQSRGQWGDTGSLGVGSWMAATTQGREGRGRQPSKLEDDRAKWKMKASSLC
jgi:hypothetical protein